MSVSGVNQTLYVPLSSTLQGTQSKQSGGRADNDGDGDGGGGGGGAVSYTHLTLPTTSRV